MSAKGQDDIVYEPGTNKPRICRRCKKKRFWSEPPEHLQYKTCHPCRILERSQKRKSGSGRIQSNQLRDEIDMTRLLKARMTGIPNVIDRTNAFRASMVSSSGGTPSSNNQNGSAGNGTQPHGNGSVASPEKIPQASFAAGVGGTSNCILCRSLIQGNQELCLSCFNNPVNSVVTSYDQFLNSLSSNYNDRSNSELIFMSKFPAHDIRVHSPILKFHKFSKVSERIYNTFVVPLMKQFDIKFSLELSNIDELNPEKNPDSKAEEGGRFFINIPPNTLRETYQCTQSLSGQSSKLDDIDPELLGELDSYIQRPKDEEQGDEEGEESFVDDQIKCTSTLYVSYNILSDDIIMKINQIFV